MPPTVRPRWHPPSSPTLFAVLLLVLWPTPIRAQLPEDAGTPLASPEIMELLEAGDTAAAIARLESRVESGDRSARNLGALGVLLAHVAGTVETEFVTRVRAEDLLEEALRKDPGNPRYFLAIGVVLEKRGVTNDAVRVLDRGLDAAERRPGVVPPYEVAEAIYRRARTQETHVREFDDLKFLGTADPPVSTPACEGAGAFCLNWERPRRFFEWFEPLHDLGSLVRNARAEMMEGFRRATRVDSTHEGAWRGILADAALGRAWAEMAEEARAFYRAAPDNPWSAIFLGAALQRLDARDTAAATLFETGIAALPPEDRAIFHDLALIADSEGAAYWGELAPAARDSIRELYWAVRDPLFLTSANERRSEHYARVALAELLFGEPQSGLRGWQTDRGSILVRYGVPEAVWQIRREDGLVLHPDAAAQLRGWLADCQDQQSMEPRDPRQPVGSAVCAGAPAVAGARDYGGGRWIFWNYDPDAPSFIFEKALGRARVTHANPTLSGEVARLARESRPTTYRAPFTDLGDIDHQVARFRGNEPGTHEVELYARPPVSELLGDRDSAAVAGLFVFPRGRTEPLVASRRELRTGARAAADYRLTLPPGVYNYSLEAASPDESRAARARGEIIVGAYSPQRLQLSDLLLTQGIRPPPGGAASRRDLVHEPLRCLRLPADGRMGIIFEVYGLAVSDGLSRYRVSIRAGEGPARSVPLRLLRGLRDLVSDPADPTISYERTVELAADRSLEWLELGVPADRLEEIEEVTVEVEDLVAGERARAVRAVGSTCRP